MAQGLFNHRTLADCRFAIVDPSVIERMPASVATTPIIPDALADSAHLMPSLLELDGLSDVQLAALLQAQDEAEAQNFPPPLALFAVTSVESEAFKNHWNALQLCKRHSPQPAWLRLHDTRVLHQLLRILPPAQTAKVFGPLSALTYWVGGEWLEVKKPEITEPLAGGATWDWPRVERIGLINRALARAGIESPTRLTVGGTQAEKFLQCAATVHRLNHRDDLVEFAARGLVCVPQFEEHPQIKALLCKSPEGDESLLADRWALIPHTVWSEVALSNFSK